MKKLSLMLSFLFFGFLAVANPAYNGRLISSEVINGVKIQHYQHEQSLRFGERTPFGMYESLKDLQNRTAPKDPEPNKKYKIYEYIVVTYDYSDFYEDSDEEYNTYYMFSENLRNISCLKLSDSRGKTFYMSYDLDYENSSWEVLGEIKLNGTNCVRHKYTQESAVWLSNKTLLYSDESLKKAPVKYDYSKMNLKDGSQHYVDIVEAAVEKQTGNVWIKIESPCGTGWVESSKGNVEKGGLHYKFPEGILDWTLIGQFEI